MLEAQCSKNYFIYSATSLQQSKVLDSPVPVSPSSFLPFTDGVGTFLWLSL